MLLALLGLALTTPLRGALPRFTRDELEVLYLLWLLFAAVSGLQNKGLFAHLAARLEAGRHLGAKLVLGTFLLAALVTNDAALLAAVPLVLALRQNRAELAVLALVAANAGSALTPFGNPQNLYLYWHYGLSPLALIGTMLPLGLGFFFLLWFLAAKIPAPAARREVPPLSGPVLPELLALLLLIAVVLRVLPFGASLLALFLLLTFHPRAFRVDYGLLLTFAAFFLFVDNLEALLAARLAHPHSVFALSVLLSQGLSNVPTAILLAPLTENWRALLWGVNVGGFGTPWASLANLIVLRLFSPQAAPDERRRLWRHYLLAQALALALGSALFFAFGA